MQRFSGKVAVVTGAGSGFGEAIAKRFAQEGAAVVVADIDADRAARVTREIEGLGGKARAVRTDVSDAARRARDDRHGGVDLRRVEHSDQQRGFSCIVRAGGNSKKRNTIGYLRQIPKACGSASNMPYRSCAPRAAASSSTPHRSARYRRPGVTVATQRKARSTMTRGLPSNWRASTSG